MNRRETLKAIGIGTLSAGVLLEACKTKKDEKTAKVADNESDKDRLPEEIERNKKLNAETFFTAHEMATITILGDIISPKDDRSGSASDAKVPEFIEVVIFCYLHII